MLFEIRLNIILEVRRPTKSGLPGPKKNLMVVVDGLCVMAYPRAGDLPVFHGYHYACSWVWSSALLCFCFRSLITDVCFVFSFRMTNIGGEIYTSTADFSIRQLCEKKSCRRRFRIKYPVFDFHLHRFSNWGRKCVQQGLS